MSMAQAISALAREFASAALITLLPAVTTAPLLADHATDQGPSWNTPGPAQAKQWALDTLKQIADIQAASSASAPAPSAPHLMAHRLGLRTSQSIQTAAQEAKQLATATISGEVISGPSSLSPVAVGRPAESMAGDRLLSRQAIYFEPNVGQADKAVSYLARGDGYQVLLTSSEALLVTRSKASNNQETALRLSLDGATPSQPQGGGLLPGQSNYFSGSDPAKWHSQVPHYASVDYVQVYPGVDLSYYGQGRTLEYDFRVAAGADPNTIALRFPDHPAVTLTVAGDLKAEISGASFLLHRPVAYQQRDGGRDLVDAQFAVREDGSVRFALGEYDHSLPLVIDPVVTLTYATYLGSVAPNAQGGFSGIDEAFDVKADAPGDAYVLLETSDTNFPVTPGAYETTFTTGCCPTNGVLAVSKFDPTGATLLYSTFIGTSNSGNFPSMALNSKGQVVVAQVDPGSDFPVTTNAYQTAAGLGAVAQLDSTGSTLLYGSYFPNQVAYSGDTGSSHSVAEDDAGSIYIIGQAGSTFPVTGTGYQTTLPSGVNSAAYLAKFDPTKSGIASLAYATYLGAQTEAVAIAVDSTQGAYVLGDLGCEGAIGACGTINAPIKNAFQPDLSGDLDAFIVKIDTAATGNSSLVYGSYLGGTSDDIPGSLALDSTSNAYITGYTYSTAAGAGAFPTTTGAYQPTATGTAAFVSKISVNGETLVYSTLVGDATAADIAVDSLGQAHLLGTAAGDFPVLNPYPGSPSVANSLSENLVAGLNSTGTGLLYATFIPQLVLPAGISVDTVGNVYVAGVGGGAASSSGTTDFQPTAGAFQQSCPAKGECAFLMKLNYGGSTSGGGGSAVTITGVTPNEAGQDDTIHISISGTGFATGATATLSRNGTTISATNVAVAAAGTSLTADFDLNGAALGTYDLVVTNSDNSTATATGAFTVLASVADIVTDADGVAGSIVTTSISAPSIQANAIVTLQLNGSTVATATNASIANGAVTATFDLTSVAAGIYDIVITNPDGTVVIIPQSFTVGSTGASQPSIDIIGRSVLRAGQKQYYYIVLGNQGNEDAELVHFHVEFPPYFQFTLGTPLSSIETTSPLPAGTVPYDESLVPPGQLADDGNMAVDLYLPYLAAGATYSIPFEFFVPDVSEYAHVPFTIDAEVDPGGFLPTPPTTLSSNARFATRNGANGTPMQALPRIGGGLTPAQGKCLQKLGLAVLVLLPPVGGLAKNAAAVALATATGLLASVVNFENPLAIEPINLSQIIWDALAGALALAGIAWPPLLIASAVISILNHLSQLEATYQACKDAFPPPPPAGVRPTKQPGKSKAKPCVNSRRRKCAKGQTIVSGDPNDKSGPIGGGTAGYIQSRLALPYGIYFENDATASAPAQTVTVTDQLDPTKVDLSTFNFGPVYIADQVFTPEPGSQSFAGQIDLRPANNIITAITGTLTASTGALQWSFTSLDPATGKPVTDPTAGFLPPNTTSPDGDGAVSFNVKSLGALTTGTAITNQATIVFDQNAPLSTPVWTNTVDNDPPVSAVTALPSTDPAIFPLAWTGTDAGSGIGQYNIYVSDNGGPFQLWQAEQTNSDTYSGTLGHTYAFYSIAEDLAGNIEGTKTAAEATTTVSTGNGASSIALSSAATQILPSGTATFTATVTGSNPTGTLLFTLNDVPQDPVTLAGGSASITFYNLPGGPNDVSAFYSGDSVNAPSTAGPLTINVLTSVTTLALAIPATTPGGSAQIGVSASNTAGTVTGPVQIMVNNATYAATLANNAGTVTLPMLPVGSYRVIAAFQGGGDQSQAIANGTLIVAQSPSATTLTSSAAQGTTAGQSVTLTATVTGVTGNPAPTGTVQFAVGTMSLGSAPLNAQGVVTLAVTTLPLGTDTIAASYSGDTNYAASSGTITLTVTAAVIPSFTLALSTASVTIDGSGSGTETVTISPQNGFSQPVSFACSGLPANTSCSFSPAAVTPTGTASVTSTLTIAYNSNSSKATPRNGDRPAQNDTNGPWIALCFIGVGGVLRSRRKFRTSFMWKKCTGFGALLMLAVLIAAGTLQGCGSSRPSQQSSTVTVTATSGTEMETTTFTLVVN